MNDMRQTYQLIQVRRQRIDRLIDSASMLAGRLSVNLMTDLVPQLLPQLRKNGAATREGYRSAPGYDGDDMSELTDP